jgi:hypothetical protein
MKILYYFVLPIAFISLGCASASNTELDHSNSNLVYQERVYLDESRSLSVIFPEPWYTIDDSEEEYKAIVGGPIVENGIVFTPLIHFFISSVSFYDKLNELVDDVLERWGDEVFGGEISVVSRDVFVTLKNLAGERIIITRSNSVGKVREIYYFFLGENNALIIVNCIVQMEADDTFDARFDNIIKTLEWVR